MIYNLNTKLEFGKYKNSTIKEVISLQPSYLNWCVTHIEDFQLHDDVLVCISKKEFTNLEISEGIYNILNRISNKVITQILSKDKFITDYISIDSYSNIDMVLLTNTRGRHFSMKFGKFISKICTDNFLKHSTSDIEYCVNSFKSIRDSFNYEIVLLEGKDIKDAYDGELYEIGEGTLQSSCMKYKKCRYYLNIYSKNKNNVKLLVLKNKISGLIIGRAIIWKNANIMVQGKTTITVDLMDRIYVTKEHQVNIFIEWAKTNNIAYKTQQNYEPLTPLMFKGELLEQPLIWTKLENYDFDQYPYMDTLYSVIEGGYISNTQPFNISHFIGMSASNLFDIKSIKGNYIDDKRIKFIENRRTDGSKYIRDYENSYQSL